MNKRENVSREAWTEGKGSEVTMENDSGNDPKKEHGIEDFAESTSMHGVYFMHRSQSKCAKGFWIFLIIVMIGMLAFQIVQRVIAYFEYETSTSITEEFVTSLPFPAVTICSFNRFYVESPHPKMLRAIHLLNQQITPENVAINAHLDTKPNLTEMMTLDNRIDVKRLLKRYGFKLNEEAMPRCYYQYFECDSSDFTEILSWMGACHTFNVGNETKTQSIPGSGHALSMTINAQTYLYTEEPIMGIRDTGIRLQVHPRHEIPDVGTFGISIPTGRRASIEISRNDYELMYKPWGKCDPAREHLKYFTTYTLNNCLNECYTKAVINECGCYLFSQHWAEGHAEQCTAEQMQDCAAESLIYVQQTSSAESCNCTVPCKFTSFDTSISYATYPNPTTSSALAEMLNSTVEEAEENSVEFDIYFKSMSYSKFVQSKKVDESGLLSDIGGQLGLWLGMSIITAVEVVQFCGLRITNWNKKKSS